MRPLAYFITFHTYATWLHGDERGSVDDEHAVPGTPVLEPSPGRERYEKSLASHAPYVLSEAGRAVVDRTIRGVCEHRGWRLHAINVRTNHVHAEVEADADVAKVLHDLKAWPTRRLVEAGLLQAGRSAWGRHGSTRYVHTPDSLTSAIDYVTRMQDLPRTRS